MSTDEFRRQGRAVIDWIADYLDQVERYPVLSRVKPGEVRSHLPEHAPQHGEPFENMLRDVQDVLLPGLTHWQSPSFFGYFPANVSGPSILGELLCAGLGVQGMLWTTSPACTELETQVLDWLVDMLGLPAGFRSSAAGGGVLQDTASSSTLCALLAARERATGFRSNTAGLAQPLVAYASAEAHSSVEKAVRIAGLGDRRLRRIPADDDFAMRPDALSRAIEEDFGAGLQPCFVCATVGTTSSNGLDPLRPIGALCRRHGVWLHVDAAMSGTAALCPEFRYIQDGLDLADSYCFNPHKWMLTNFDCDCFYVKDRSTLIRTLSILPEYLRNQATAAGRVFDYRDWHIPLGRRFRALKLWFVIRYYGVTGLQQHIRHHVELAQLFRSWVEQNADFEVAAPTPLSLVCFRHRGGDEMNQRILDHVNASGSLFLTHTRLRERLTLRMAIGQPRTERRHVEQAWQAIRSAANQP